MRPSEETKQIADVAKEQHSKQTKTVVGSFKQTWIDKHLGNKIFKFRDPQQICNPQETEQNYNPYWTLQEVASRCHYVAASSHSWFCSESCHHFCPCRFPVRFQIWRAGIVVIENGSQEAWELTLLCRYAQLLFQADALAVFLRQALQPTSYFLSYCLSLRFICPLDEIYNSLAARRCVMEAINIDYAE